MLKITTVVFSVLFGLLVLSDLVHADGAATFNTKCKACHGPDGKGNPALKMMKPMDTSKSDADLQKVVADGKGKMIPYKGKLSDAEISEVVKYLKSLK